LFEVWHVEELNRNTRELEEKFDRQKRGQEEQLEEERKAATFQK